MSAPTPTAGSGSNAAVIDTATTIGVTGIACRSTVTGWGDVAVHRADGHTDLLTWHVAAGDRWHAPAAEPSVRQRRLGGTPVVETRLAVPDGDLVQRVWAVPERGGLTVIEFENISPLPLAVALSGAPLLTERPPADVPVQGIDLPDDTIVMPIGHHATVRVAVAHGDVVTTGYPRVGTLPPAPPALAVVRGWTTVIERASRLVLPDDDLVEALAAARCDLLLDGPVDASDDPVGFLFDVTELVRLGEPGDDWMPEIVEPLAAVARRDDPDVDRVIDACEALALRADDARAAGDVAKMRARRRRDGHSAQAAPITSFSQVRRGPSVGRFVSEIERRIADGGDLLVAGLPTSWLGANFEVHGVPTGPRSTVSFAVRWHGERPAVLWEQRGETIELRAPAVDPAWTTAATTGDALWAAPPRPTRLGLNVITG